MAINLILVYLNIQPNKFMPNYHEIKQQELNTTKNYSNRKFNLYLIGHKVLMRLSSQFSYWLMSFVIFMAFALLSFNDPMIYLFMLVCHFLFWEFWGINRHHKDMSELRIELELTIRVLEDIKKERNS